MSGPMSADDRMIADVFAKSYREYLEIRPTHYRWTHLAPQSLEVLREAEECNWSLEKIADYLHCEVEEAEGCLRRYVVSKKVNARDTESLRLRQALAEWVGTQPGGEELVEKERWEKAGELAAIVANHIHAAALAGEDFMKLSKDLEPEDVSSGPGRGQSPDQGGRTWGPQWKD
ncbi:MAG TPA: hypothetical protein VK465_02395 [Fibrobacteria bacterium]|nr:hypothetical protein [Fibrobacteria bacterium]